VAVDSGSRFGIRQLQLFRIAVESMGFKNDSGEGHLPTDKIKNILTRIFAQADWVYHRPQRLTCRILLKSKGNLCRHFDIQDFPFRHK